MALKVQLLVLTLAMLVAAEAKELIIPMDLQWLPAASTNFDAMELGDQRMCNGLVDECIGDDEEMMMETEASRQVHEQRRRRFVSYRALKKDMVPCNRRGQSYYNCRRTGKANPYRRGCNVITQCKRFTN